MTLSHGHTWPQSLVLPVHDHTELAVCPNGTDFSKYGAFYLKNEVSADGLVSIDRLS